MTEHEGAKGESADDRREHVRRLVCVVAEVETADKSALALIRNVSTSGALLFAARDLEVDARVELLIHTSSDPSAAKIHTSGTVVRRVALDPGRSDLWRWEIGVHFDEPLAGRDEELERISQRLQQRR